MVAYTFYETDNRVRRYAETLVKRGEHVDAIALRRERQPFFEVIKGVHVYRIQKRVINEKGPLSYLRRLVMFFLRSAWFLAKSHLKGRYDLIHVHSVPDFQVFATFVPRLLGASIILDIHDIVPEFYASKFKVDERSFVFRLLLFIERLSAAYSDHVIIANHLWYSKIIQRSVDPGKCTVIINYPDTSIFARRPQTCGASRDFVMCYPGTLNWHQGVDLAINALVLLRDKVPNLKFLIIGDGPERENLKVLVKRHKLEDRITMVGLVPMEEVAVTMCTVNLGVVPKRKDAFSNEAFSTKIMEFMAVGVPVVVSNTTIDRYYFNSQLVQFFEADSVNDLAAKILELINDPAKCRTLREASMRFSQQNSWDVKKAEYLDLVDHLTATKCYGQSRVPDPAGRNATQ
jgi:glycosyltransferase involved in cell wall biosynthesis